MAIISYKESQKKRLFSEVSKKIKEQDRQEFKEKVKQTGEYGKQAFESGKEILGRAVERLEKGKIGPATSAQEKSVAKRFRMETGEIRRAITKEQQLLQRVFHGEPTFGTGQNLPQLNRRLTSGGGIIKSGDTNSETAGMFGLV